MRYLHPLLAMAFVFVVVLACGGKPAARVPEGQFKGTTPIVFVNATNTTICTITIEAEYKTATLIDGTDTWVEGSTRDRCLPAGGRSTQYGLLAGKYELHIKGAKYDELVYRSPLPVMEPTEAVIYDATPPAASAGFKLAAFQSEIYKRAQASNQASANATRARQACLAKVPSESERPAPGKVKGTGKWKCVFGGFYKGTDFVDLVQLADGKITATVSGSDRNATWSGAIVGDQVHFRFGDVTASGGSLKLDPTGRAMSGSGFTFTAGGTCETWTLTCTK